jgi:type IV fimbrial biogenesis protein FimT
VEDSAVRSSTTGFTLLEALLAAAIVATTATLGGPRLLRLVETVRVADAAQVTATTLRLARSDALARGAPVTVRFDTRLGRLETRDAGGTVLADRPLPPGVVISGLPRRGSIAFSGLGSADNGTVEMTAGGVVRRVIVNQRGRVRVS